MTPVVITIFGQPTTKKTSNQMGKIKSGPHAGKTRMFPAIAWREWVRAAVIVHQLDLLACHEMPAQLDTKTKLFLGAGGPIVTEQCNCRALFFLTPRQNGDSHGYYQGLADLLQERGVLPDDRLIKTWDGSRLLLDPKRPRVEILFTDPISDAAHEEELHAVRNQLNTVSTRAQIYERALRGVRDHHQALNNEKGRPLDRSHILQLVETALKYAAKP